MLAQVSSSVSLPPPAPDDADDEAWEREYLAIQADRDALMEELAELRWRESPERSDYLAGLSARALGWEG